MAWNNVDFPTFASPTYFTVVFGQHKPINLEAEMGPSTYDTADEEPGQHSPISVGLRPRSSPTFLASSQACRAVSSSLQPVSWEASFSCCSSIHQE